MSSAGCDFRRPTVRRSSSSRCRSKGRSGSFEDFSGLKRELLRPQPGAVIGWRLAEACAASEIVLLPFLGVRLGARYLEVLVECSPALGPRRIRLLHLRISFHCAKFRLNPFDRAALYREHHAKGF